MDKNQILRMLEEQLEIDKGTLSIEKELDEIDEWDSMAAVVFLALADTEFNKTINTKDLNNCKVIGDLVKLLI